MNEVPSECSTYEDICTFCMEARGQPNKFHDLGISDGSTSYILLESAHFVIVPCIGALTDWYVLAVPRRHALSTGWLTESERSDLRDLCAQVASAMESKTGHEVVIFEHGSYNYRDKGGACHDHAHIHLVATERPVSEFVNYVSAVVDLQPCGDWIDAAATMVGGSLRSYLALASASGSWIAHADNAPSGFFRKSLMRWLGGDPAEHDWLVFPQVERLRAMVSAGL